MRLAQSTLSLLALTALFAGCGSGPQVTIGTNGAMHVVTSEGTATMGQTVPSDWPSDVPVYGGATVTYSASVNPQTGKPGMAIVLTTTDAMATVATYYKTELASRGWAVQSALESAGNSIFSAVKDNRTVSLLIAGAEGQTTITIGIEKME